MNMWQGDRVRLRAVELSDLDNYFMAEEVVDTNAQRNGDRLLQPISKANMTERVEKLSKSNPHNDDFFYIIENADGVPVGNINTHSCNPTYGTFAYGLGIKKAYRGNGYAREAVKLLLRYYFLERGFRKVETKVYDFNHASIKLHESMGYVTEGRLRKSHYSKGDYHDIVCFGMLREEFRDLYGDFVGDYLNQD